MRRKALPPAHDSQRTALLPLGSLTCATGRPAAARCSRAGSACAPRRTGTGVRAWHAGCCRQTRQRRGPSACQGSGWGCSRARAAVAGAATLASIAGDGCALLAVADCMSCRRGRRKAAAAQNKDGIERGGQLKGLHRHSSQMDRQCWRRAVQELPRRALKCLLSAAAIKVGLEVARRAEIRLGQRASRSEAEAESGRVATGALQSWGAARARVRAGRRDAAAVGEAPVGDSNHGMAHVFLHTAFPRPRP